MPNKLIRFSAFLFWLTLLAAPILVSASLFDLGTHYFEQVKRDDGDNVITAIVQDKNGFVWWGTQTDLVRYDGYSYLTFNNAQRHY